MRYLEVAKDLETEFLNSSNPEKDKISIEYFPTNVYFKSGGESKEVIENIQLRITGKYNNESQIIGTLDYTSEIYDRINQKSYSDMVVTVQDSPINFSSVGDDLLPSFLMNLQIKYQKKNNLNIEETENILMNVREKNGQEEILVVKKGD